MTNGRPVAEGVAQELDVEPTELDRAIKKADTKTERRKRIKSLLKKIGKFKVPKISGKPKAIPKTVPKVVKSKAVNIEALLSVPKGFKQKQPESKIMGQNVFFINGQENNLKQNGGKRKILNSGNLFFK